MIFSKLHEYYYCQLLSLLSFCFYTSWMFIHLFILLFVLWILFLINEGMRDWNFVWTILNFILVFLQPNDDFRPPPANPDGVSGILGSSQLFSDQFICSLSADQSLPSPRPIRSVNSLPSHGLPRLQTIVRRTTNDSLAKPPLTALAPVASVAISRGEAAVGSLALSPWRAKPFERPLPTQPFMMVASSHANYAQHHVVDCPPLVTKSNMAKKRKVLSSAVVSACGHSPPRRSSLHFAFIIHFIAALRHYFVTWFYL